MRPLIMDPTLPPRPPAQPLDELLPRRRRSGNYDIFTKASRVASQYRGQLVVQVGDDRRNVSVNIGRLVAEGELVYRTGESAIFYNIGGRHLFVSGKQWQVHREPGDIRYQPRWKHGFGDSEGSGAYFHLPEPLRERFEELKRELDNYLRERSERLNSPRQTVSTD